MLPAWRSKAARAGARVLVIRNTVDRARETWRACVEAAPELVFSLEGVQTLHHSRFAAEDRARLDAQVEAVLGAGRGTGGMIVVGTQTLEQSLDIDADFLVTDLCPMDVCCSASGGCTATRGCRPQGFETAAAVVLCPEGGLDPLTREPENGLGAFGRNASLSGVYLDVPGLAATLAEIEANPRLAYPGHEPRTGGTGHASRAAGRDRATERLAGLSPPRHRQGHRRDSRGGTGRPRPNGGVPCQFPDDEVIRTRLGEQGAILTLPEGTIGPFGHPIGTLALPVTGRAA